MAKRTRMMKKSSFKFNKVSPTSLRLTIWLSIARLRDKDVSCGDGLDLAARRTC